jgi:hypothetical protein
VSRSILSRSTRLRRTLIVCAVVVTGILTTTPPVDAAFGRLVPCGNTITVNQTGGETCYTGECTICDVQILAMNILRFMVAFVILMAALLFVNAGVLYIMSPANPGNIARAHKMFTSTIVGLIIVLAAYLIIDTIMRALYSQGPLGPWSEFLCNGTAVTVQCVPAIDQAQIGVSMQAP